MGLRDTLQSAALRAITSSIGDVASTVVLTSNTVTSYDPVAGAVSNTATPHIVTGLLTSLDQKLIGTASYTETGRKLLVPGTLLAGIDVDALDDRVTVDGTPWVVKEVKVDPAGALYTFILAACAGVSV